MFRDWKVTGLAIVAVVALVVAGILGTRSSKLREEQARVQSQLTACQEDNRNLDQQITRLSGQLGTLRSDYENLRIEYDQLKARRTGGQKAARAR